MAGDSIYDYANPFDIMVGAWTGHSVLYDKKGVYQVSGPSLVWIHWIKPGKVLRYFQEDLTSIDDLALLHEEHRESFSDTIRTRAFDLAVDGKSCRSDDKSDLTSPIKVEGVESLPGTYLFHLDFPSTAEDGSGGDYYNNQYFEGANQRHIIGPYVPKSGRGIGSVIAQTFTRIAYGDNIPEKFIAMEKYHIEQMGKASS
jgi:hypothetical protein